MLSHDVKQIAVIAERTLAALDPSLGLVRLRTGQSVFPLYDPTSGMPTVKEIVVILRTGVGYPDELSMGRLPADKQSLLLPEGWGMRGVECVADPKEFLSALIAEANVLLEECRKAA